MAKYYSGDEVEVRYFDKPCKGIVTGFYGDGKPRIVDSNGNPYMLPDWVLKDEYIALVKAGPERQKMEQYFNRRSFLARFCYLFTGKMP